jgi:hypothetical protein
MKNVVLGLISYPHPLGKGRWIWSIPQSEPKTLDLKRG